ncbi:MAG: RloB domain-containing protein [Lachnospiraceae bacterium]|nr:RloB domain-containing protein [Lachnospiraceae bacterium]
MGSDDLFKKRREDRKKRTHDFRVPKANSYLIVTEGKKTEPLYFSGIKDKILASVGGTVDIVDLPLIDIYGEGASTEKLIEITEEYVSKAKIIYQNIWVIFDKDDFADFDSAVALGKSKGYSVGWSNQCFEYWIFLHFEYSDSDLHRSQWFEKLNSLFKANHLTEHGYEKNLENLYDLLDSIDGISTAIKNAKRRMADYREGIDKPSDMSPGTTVHLLVEQLRDYIS